MRRTSFTHDVLLYGDGSDLATALSPLVSDAHERGAALCVALPRAHHASMAALLDPADTVVELDDSLRNPGRAIGLWAGALQDAAASGRPLVAIGEPIWPGRSDVEITEVLINEELIDVAYADVEGFHLVCPYDHAALDTGVVDDALRIHRTVHDGRASAPNDRFDPPQTGVLERRLDPAPPGARSWDVALHSLPSLRDRLRAFAIELGAGDHVVDDLLIAANELATNSVLHGGGTGRLEVWHDDASLWCQVRDAGRIEDPLAGRTPPEPHSPGGRGIWMAQQVCDLVQVRSDGSGTCVRIRIALD